MPGHATERCVTGVGFATVLSALLIVLTAPIASAQTRTRLGSYRLADVYRIDLPAHKGTTVTPRTARGLVWVAITVGTIVVDGVAADVGQGAAARQKGAAAVGFRADGTNAARFVVVDLSAATEEVEIENPPLPISMARPDRGDPIKAREHKDWSLEPGNTIDAVHTPEYLLVAMAPLALKVEVELSEEGEPRRMAKPAVVKLDVGGVHWLPSGPMLITNIGETNARFVEIGWIWRVK